MGIQLLTDGNGTETGVIAEEYREKLKHAGQHISMADGQLPVVIPGR